MPSDQGVTDPGASRYGNFINYYQFHSADERIRQLEEVDVWRCLHPDQKYIGLDVGCNAGDLTSALTTFINQQLPNCSTNILAIDLDPILIKRASENYNQQSNIKFKILDFTDNNEKDKIINEYLKQYKRCKFDVVFCFSITMWIHLNHGDEGLIKFLQDIAMITEMIVIEPQPWKCYRNASRRLRRAGINDFPLINSLKLSGNIEQHIINIITQDCGFEKVKNTDDNTWGRKLLIFQRSIVFQK